jgi:hypothetical protein
MSGFDYRSMLVRYIATVIDYEGIDCLAENLGPDFSDEEAEELHRLVVEGMVWLRAMRQ